MDDHNAEPIPFGKYFVAAKAVVLRDDGRMLTLLRGETAPTNPLHWDLPGGIVEYGEALDACVTRETMEEAGIEVVALRVFHAMARMNAIGEFWTTIFFVGRAQSTDVTISWEHIDSHWVSPEEFLTMKASLRQRETIELFIARRNERNI